MKRRLAAVLAGSASLVAAWLGLGRADAQRLDPRRPAAFVVGAPRGPSPTLRGDARRSGATAALLPAGTLRVAWRKVIGTPVEHPALAGEGGTIAVLTTRGDVVFLDASGEERGRASSGLTAVGPPTMTSDGTVLFLSGAGDAVGVRRASPRPRFVARIGGERNMRAAPLSLDDGGAVVATLTDLVLLDSEGNVRARTTLPEAPAAPLLAEGDRVLAVITSGAVLAWTPGREPVRLGSFGAPIDGGAALGGNGALLGVIDGNHLVELDLARGIRTTRSLSAQGLYLGPPTVRTATADAGATVLATLLLQTPSRGFVVTLDPAGQELARAGVATFVPATLGDGGLAPLTARPHVPPLVDARGVVAFAAPEGQVGTVKPDGSVEVLGESPCTQGGTTGRVAGLTGAGAGAFVVTCENGVVAGITGTGRPGAAPGD
ncbi:MAG: hypothetical protein JWP97_4472 [Labilithrix sp.]|nr:hypothetical protein [Labilithrix sp.]